MQWLLFDAPVDVALKLHIRTLEKSEEMKALVDEEEDKSVNRIRVLFQFSFTSHDIRISEVMHRVRFQKQYRIHSLMD
jgi:hypothetical protein